MKLEKKTPLLFLILISFGLITYSNTLSHSFVWDDAFLIVKNTLIKNWQHLPQLFTSELRMFGPDISNYYRPIQSLSYMIDYSIWQLNPFGYHLSNILLHISVSLLAFALVKHLSKNNIIAFLSSTLFLVHPIHTEAVTYVAGRADLLASLFLLSSFLLFIKHSATTRNASTKNLYFILSIFSFILALLSKEFTIVYPCLLLFYDFSTNKEKKKSFYLEHSLFFIIGFVYIALRLTYLHFLPSALLTSFEITGPFLSRLLTATNIIFLYLKLLFLPSDLHLMRTVQTLPLFSFNSLLALLLFLSTNFTLFIIYRRFKVLFFYCLWFLLFLFPTLNLFPIGASIAEHFLYLPSIGFFAVISTFMVNHVHSKKLLSILMGSIILYFASFTYIQNNVWKDNLSLYTYHLRHVPDNFVINNNLGNEYLMRGDFDKSQMLFEKVLQINPKYAYAYNNLGNVHSANNKDEEAINAYIKAVQLRPDLLEPHVNLGKIYIKLKDYSKAVAEFNSILKTNPQHIESYQNLGIIASTLNNKTLAVTHYKKALEIDANYIPAYYNLGFIYYNENDFSAARHWWNQALKIAPDDVHIKSALEKLKTFHNSAQN